MSPRPEGWPEIVGEDRWRAAREEILRREKELTRAHDDLAAARRRLPMVEVTKDYTFTGPDGERSLPDLFDGRRQLIVYHHMLQPQDDSPCAGCSMVADQLPHLAHLHARDTSLVLVSRAPIDEIEAFRKRMGWEVPWYSTSDDFNPDHDVEGGFGLNVFLRDPTNGEDRVYRTYFTKGRGVETLGTPWTFLDLTPFGRQETWEETPAGRPQAKPYQWWRLHDEY